MRRWAQGRTPNRRIELGNNSKCRQLRVACGELGPVPMEKDEEGDGQKEPHFINQEEVGLNQEGKDKEEKDEA